MSVHANHHIRSLDDGVGLDSRLETQLLRGVLVMMETISKPGASSTTTLVSPATGVTALTVADNTLRALIFMRVFLYKQIFVDPKQS